MSVTQKAIGKRVKELRIKNWEKYSQEEIAKILEINRVTLSLIENGERALKEIEIQKLSEIFEVDVNEFKMTSKIESIKKSDDLYNFKNILLYILNEVEEKKNVWKTVLYKLLYFIEFNHFETYWDTLLWIDFIKWPKWPVPYNAHKIFDMMKERNQLEERVCDFGWYNQYRLFAKLEDIDISYLWKDKIKLINNVIDKFWDWTATKISEYSHWDMPYRATEKIGAIIPKELVFYRSAAYSVSKE